MIREFLDRFSKKSTNTKFMKIRPVGAEFQRTDGRTDRQTDRHDKGNSRFSQFFESA
jgi:hypothetical protein